MPEMLVELIAEMYTGTAAKVATADGITEAFDILAGVLQAGTLGPYVHIYSSSL